MAGVNPWVKRARITPLEKRSTALARGKHGAGAWLQGTLLAVARQARADIAHLGTDEVQGVHRLRKRMKKLRALLSLGGKVTGKGQTRMLRKDVRELRHVFAEQRDAHVLGELCRELGGGGNLPQTAEVSAKSAQVKRATALAARLARGVGALLLDGLRWRDVEKAYHKSCRRARIAWREAKLHPSPEALHACRKQVKRLYCQSLALEPWLERPKQLRRLRKLGSALGDCHDVDVFAELLNAAALKGTEDLGHRLREKRKTLLPEIERRAEKALERWSAGKVRRECRKALPG